MAGSYHGIGPAGLKPPGKGGGIHAASATLLCKLTLTASGRVIAVTVKDFIFFPYKYQESKKWIKYADGFQLAARLRTK